MVAQNEKIFYDEICYFPLLSFIFRIQMKNFSKFMKLPLL